MHIPCDECGEPSPVKELDIEPYVQVKTPVSHLGIVREWYICKGCAEEKRLWKLDLEKLSGI
jgi:hypothetical protein